MCGIVGILGRQAVAGRMLEVLRRLEYRGYDSAGLATLEGGCLERRRAEGRLRNLELKLSLAPLSGAIGIGHTRWATHGRACEINAQPHTTARLAVVHNGIVENFREIRAALQAEGVAFETETDTEAVARAVTHAMDQGLSPVAAVAATVPQLRGAFALAFLFQGEEDLLVGARNGAPLAVGFGDGEVYLGSDAMALAPLADTISYLDNGDLAVLSRRGMTLWDAAGHPATRPCRPIPRGDLLVDKAPHHHFMAKEIHEQPEAVGRTLAHYLDLTAGTAGLPIAPGDLAQLSRLRVVACGTALHAGMVARYWFERIARLPVDVEVASEARYRGTPLDPAGATLAISQSGETADTLGALRQAMAQGQKGLALVNVPESSIARAADIGLPTLAGPEIGVASTKAFTCQLAALFCLAVAAGRARGVLDTAAEQRLVGELTRVPRLMAEALELSARAEALARRLSEAGAVLYLGRGTGYPMALEGALKLKEISYLHAEGYAAGELKHGPIALIEEGLPVLVVAPQDELFEKTASNMQEVAARGGHIILIGDAAAAAAHGLAGAETLVMPDLDPVIAPLVYAVPLQLIAYHAAVQLGRDVDRPRNLAKSVTVE